MASNIRYIGMDVHKESISIAVRNSFGKVVMENVIETKARGAFVAIIRTTIKSPVGKGPLTQVAHEHGLLSHPSVLIQWQSFRRPAELVPPCS